MNEAESANRKRARFFFVLGVVTLSLFLLLLFAVGGRQRVTAASEGAQSSDGIWQDVNEATLRLTGERPIVPTAYRAVSLDWTALNSLLAEAPADLPQAASPALILSLPLPDGGYGRFQIYQSSVMHPDLAAKFPEIQTYAGIGIDDPTAIVRLDTTPKGFHAMILSGNGRVFIDPYSNSGIDLYQSYFASDFVPNLPADFEPDVVLASINEDLAKPEAIAGAISSGGQLRTYRLAVAATGEYTQYQGGTVPLALAEIVTAVNRVSGIYEREVAVKLELIANNEDIIYTDGATDPYSNNDGYAMLTQNQSNLDDVNVIGSANYDIGHVFSTGGGGIAGLGVICVAGQKAQGVTGLIDPIGDPFYVDYVAHEIGHQFNANHSFNGNASSCGGGRNGGTAYEPGSGSTIMAYAGICGPQNIQSNSDDYFHGISFDEIVSFSTVGSGNGCAAISSTGNTPPTVDAGVNYNIPLNTPFTLTGLATDPDGTASLTYNWEQFDLGPAGDPRFPSGNAPIFRSFSPTPSPSRTFPQISDIVNNTETIGELLPSYARTMNFRLTARDNQTPAGGVASAVMTVTAVSSTGPFLVTYPDTAVTPWTGNAAETVTWNVAGTNQTPISCANVKIDLSTDGGFTYPTTLLASTANDGSANVTVPNINSSTARVRVACADNIFFDISDANFTIQLGGGPTPTPIPTNTPTPPSLTVSKGVAPLGSVTAGDTLTYTIDVNNVGGSPASNTTVSDNFDVALVNPVCEEVPGNLLLTDVMIGSGSSVSYSCTARVDPSLLLEIVHTAVPSQIISGEAVTYTITISNSHSSLSLSNVQVSAPNVTGCTPALGTSQTLGPGASQTYTCPNNVINSPLPSTATVTGELTISNIASASDPDYNSGTPENSNMVQSQAIITASDTATVVLSDYFYMYQPVVAR
jgi:uncharacterized repeat protein (TIGR01451 family)